MFWPIPSLGLGTLSMFDKKRIAIIPARSGSKRLKNKNALEINGHPMMAYPISVALSSGLFDQVIVSTDSDEYCDIAKEYGAKTQLRPLNLSTDNVGVVSVCEHVIEDFKTTDVFCCIYATAIFLTRQDLINSCKMLIDYPSTNYVMGVSEYNYPPEKALVEHNGYLTSRWPEYKTTQSQKLSRCVVSNGTIYWARREQFLDEKTFYGEGLKGFITPAVDIDTAEDFERAKSVASRSNLELIEVSSHTKEISHEY